MTPADYELGLETKKSYCKKAFLPIFLLLVGIGMVVGGLEVVVRQDKSHGLALILLGVPVLIPGTYYSYKVWQGCRGQQGFDSIPDV